MIRKLFILLLVLGIVTACSDKPTPDVPVLDANGIYFSTDVKTRGESTTTANIREFICFGYQHGEKLWADVKTTATSDLMWNNKYTGSGNNWAGETATTWPLGDVNQKYSFFAYAPQESATNKVELLTTQADVGYQRLRYQTLSNVENHVDLIVTSRENQHRANSVTLAFVHALTRVGFQAFTNIAGTKINHISIKGVKYKGELPINSDVKWENISTDKADFKVEMVPALSVSSDETKPTDLSLIARYCFNLLPQDLKLNVDGATCVSINYTQAGIEFTKDYTIVEDLAKGRFTVYKVNLNGNPNSDLIVSQVIVEDWVFDSESNLNTGGGTQEYEKFTASYDANGGGGVPPSQTIAANKLLTIGAAPTSTPSADHVFAGYNTKADGSGIFYMPTDKIMLTADLVLYAAWDLNYMVINDIKWAKGNLISNGAGKATIGKPTDGGLYFQFGSLLGWKGGATGTGAGRSVLGNAAFFGGATFKAADEVGVYPTTFNVLSAIGTTWPNQTTNLYYFGDNTVFSSNFDLKDFAGYIGGTMAVNGIGDACRYYMGANSGWRMPTTQELDELYNTALNIERTGNWLIPSVDANLVLTYNGNVKLTLPIVGYRAEDGKLNNNGLFGYYSTSSVYDGTSRYYLYAGKVELDAKANDLRHTAMPIRCVKEQ